VARKLLAQMGGADEQYAGDDAALPERGADW